MESTYENPVNKSKHRKCCKCGEKGQAAKRTKEGLICQKCYGRFYRRYWAKAQCSKCKKKLKKLDYKDRSGKPICKECFFG